jgi:hypothetical protein
MRQWKLADCCVCPKSIREHSVVLGIMLLSMRQGCSSSFLQNGVCYVGGCGPDVLQSPTEVDCVLGRGDAGSILSIMECLLIGLLSINPCRLFLLRSPSG